MLVKLTQYGHLEVFSRPDLTGPSTVVLSKVAAKRLDKAPLTASIEKASIMQHSIYVSPNRCALLEVGSPAAGERGCPIKVDDGAVVGFIDEALNRDQFRY